MKKRYLYLLSISIVMIFVLLFFNSCNKVDADDLYSDFSEYKLNVGGYEDNQEIERAYIDEGGVIRELGREFHNESVNEIYPVRYNDSIIVCGKEILLYPTFVSQEDALDSIKKMIPELLDELADIYALGELKPSSLEEYEDARCRYINDKFGEITGEKQDQIDRLEVFISTFGNKWRNQEIKNMVLAFSQNQTDTLSKYEEACILRRLEILLPSYSIPVYDNIPEVEEIFSGYNKVQLT